MAKANQDISRLEAQRNDDAMGTRIQAEENMLSRNALPHRKTTYTKPNEFKKYHQKSGGRLTQKVVATEANDENIEEEDANDISLITLDSMTRKIKQNTNHLGSNNPFQHEKLYKPGSKANKGA